MGLENELNTDHTETPADKALNRRRFLGVAATTGSAALAGCTLDRDGLEISFSGSTGDDASGATEGDGSDDQATDTGDTDPADDTQEGTVDDDDEGGESGDDTAEDTDDDGDEETDSGTAEDTDDDGETDEEESDEEDADDAENGDDVDDEEVVTHFRVGDFSLTSKEGDLDIYGNINIRGVYDEDEFINPLGRSDWVVWERDESSSYPLEEDVQRTVVGADSTVEFPGHVMEDHEETDPYIIVRADMMRKMEQSSDISLGWDSLRVHLDSDPDAESEEQTLSFTQERHDVRLTYLLTPLPNY